MGLEFFIALRHLMSRERRALISIITVISIVGVVVGVTALIMVIAVMDGAQKDYLKRLIDFNAHLQVLQVEMGPYGPRAGEMQDYRKVLEVVEEDPEVVATSALVQRFAMLKTEGREGGRTESFRPAQVLGIDPERERKVSRMAQDPEDVQGKSLPGRGEIVLGAELAAKMGLWLGDSVRVFSGSYATTGLGISFKSSQLRVAGVFKSGVYDVDEMFSYVSIQEAQGLNSLDDVVDMIHAKVRDPYEIDAIRQRIEARLGPAYYVRTWAELNPPLFYALKLEKLGMFVITMLVVMVAALNIVATLILVTMEKTREIGILRAMGMSRRTIRRVFMLEGLLIGVVGTGLGVILGLVGCYILKYHCPFEIPEAVYGLKGLPVLVRPVTVLVICATSICVCLLAAVIPAFQASRLDIVEALRYE
ncbi:ABC transporter permease [Candidatus Sumerlaeota bacterium]|nr:ABC transporter permease [Candidatus Sumerlaeota bacterium]